MSARHYGLSLAVCASLSFVLAGCSHAPESAADPVTGAGAPQISARQVKSDPDNTDETLWTWLGMAKRRSENQVGPMTGSTVSPILWEAAQDTLKFAGFSAEDPLTGLLITKWYSPPNKPNERLRVSAFILSRALRSDSLAVTIEREVQSPDGGWQKTPVARETVGDLDNAILLRARHLHAERYRQSTYY